MEERLPGGCAQARASGQAAAVSGDGCQRQALLWGRLSFSKETSRPPLPPPPPSSLLSPVATSFQNNSEETKKKTLQPATDLLRTHLETPGGER